MKSITITISAIIAFIITTVTLLSCSTTNNNKLLYPKGIVQQKHYIGNNTYLYDIAFPYPPTPLSKGGCKVITVVSGDTWSEGETVDIK